MRSALYHGRVVHRRSAPPARRFRYGLFLLHLDLEELPRLLEGSLLFGVERARPVSFRRRDYLGDPEVPLERAVRDLVAARTGRRPEGRIGLLTHPRHAGLVFNPVSFYFCEDAGGGPEAVVTEVHNTPWNERHAYVLDWAEGCPAPEGGRLFRTPKAFHVSPFLGMDLDYLWRLEWPGERLRIGIRAERAGAPALEAELALERRPLRGATLARSLLRHPFVTAKVVGGIYAQAARLALRGATFHPHPSKRAGDAQRTSA